VLVDGFWAGLSATGSMLNSVANKTSETFTPMVEQTGAKEYLKSTGDSLKSTTNEIYEKGTEAQVF